MKKTLLVSIGLFLTMLLFTSCGGGTQIISEDAAGQTVTVKTGETIAINLKGNPTTGFSWQMLDLNTAILVQQGDPAYKADSSLIGSGGMYTYTFKAAGAGTQTLVFNYARAWETNIPPAKIFSITIKVQ